MQADGPGPRVLTITKLRGAEYLLSAVAQGVEDYFMGAGEAPGVWHGTWAGELGLEGVVEAEQLRNLVEGRHPLTGADLVAGHRERTVKAFDLTLSAPKSVSLLWAFGGDKVAAEVSMALVEASTTAVEFMERHAAVTRVQVHGVRRRIGTHGLAAAMFTHRTSRDGDPQLHVHCLVPNVVERNDGMFVALDGHPVHVWLKAGGTVFQAELQRQLTDRLGVAWGPERNGCREMLGFTPQQLRAFSKRTVAIESVLEAGGEAVDSRAERMRADDRASLRTRRKKDKTLTPERLRARWAREATDAGIPSPGRLVRTVCHQPTPADTPTRDGLFAALVDPEVGLCATTARFGEAHVIERVAALANGRLTVEQIETLTAEFLASDLVVRLAPLDVEARRRPPEWSTREHRAVEDAVVAQLDTLQTLRDEGVDGPTVFDAIDLSPVGLGEDQADAVSGLCEPGRGLRVVLAPAGHGKTALTAAAATAVANSGRPVVALAATNKAVAELHAAGLDAMTIARFRLNPTPLQAGTVVVLDEVSQVSTRDAHAVLTAVTATAGGMLWCLGDDDQGRPVQPGGLAAELHHRATAGDLDAVELMVNRRQHDPSERDALAAYRVGDVEESQSIRTEHGWDHEYASPVETRDALAVVAVADADRYGAANVAVLAVSHLDCEDLADRIRHIRSARGELAGPVLEGPGWGPDPRSYAVGDRVLCHATLTLPNRRLINGSTGTVLSVTAAGLVTRLDDDTTVEIPAGFVTGTRADGTPNLSHGWARTIDGAQGGTWDQAHLLATPTLDRLSGYVGQSRGRHPTHTWHTIADPVYEYPGLVVGDPRTPAEHTLDAVARVPERRFAAAHDPTALERRLMAERAEHDQVLAAGPKDVSRRLAETEARYGREEQECRRAWEDLRRREARVAETGGLHQLRRGSRREHQVCVENRDVAQRNLDHLQYRLRTTRSEMLGLQAADHHYQQWNQINGWRRDEVTRIERELADHWASVVLGAVRHDEPLAYAWTGSALPAPRWPSAASNSPTTLGYAETASWSRTCSGTCERNASRPSRMVRSRRSISLAVSGRSPGMGPGGTCGSGWPCVSKPKPTTASSPTAGADTLERALANLARPHAMDPLADPRAVIRAADQHGFGRDSIDVEGPERWCPESRILERFAGDRCGLLGSRWVLAFLSDGFEREAGGLDEDALLLEGHGLGEVGR